MELIIKAGLGVLLLGRFMGGYDQGHLFSVAQGEHAYEELWMHVFYHDRRHAVVNIVRQLSKTSMIQYRSCTTERNGPGGI
jgi:hypothetical protein